MDVNKLTAVVTIIVTLSIATERLVEIIKRFSGEYFQAPELNETGKPINPEEEIKHKARINLLAMLCGMITSVLASPILAGIFKDLFPTGTNCKFYGLFNLGSSGDCGFELSGGGVLIIIALGLLASGGSGMWNSILEYLLKIKDLKKTEVNKAKVEYAITVKRAERQGAIPNRSIENNNEIEEK